LTERGASLLWQNERCKNPPPFIFQKAIFVRTYAKIFSTRKGKKILGEGRDPSINPIFFVSI
jgi:hypothetical protein